MDQLNCSFNLSCYFGDNSDCPLLMNATGKINLNVLLKNFNIQIPSPSKPFDHDEKADSLPATTPLQEDEDDILLSNDAIQESIPQIKLEDVNIPEPEPVQISAPQAEQETSAPPEEEQVVDHVVVDVAHQLLNLQPTGSEQVLENTLEQVKSSNEESVTETSVIETSYEVGDSLPQVSSASTNAISEKKNSDKSEKKSIESKLSYIEKSCFTNPQNVISERQWKFILEPYPPVTVKKTRKTKKVSKL